jgi:phytol kinase
MSHRAVEWIGLAVSYAYVFGFIGLATLLMKRGRLAPKVTRKIIHIGVAHWWLIAMALFEDPWIVSIGPASFIVINALAISFRLLPAMDQGIDAHNWGTVYFPISLLILANLCWRGMMPAWVGGVGVLILGWGDGLAALAGERFGGKGMRIWGNRKTAAGSATMFAASFVVTLVFTLLFNPRFHSPAAAIGVSASVAVAATAVELATPLWIDNITIPLAAAFLYAGLFA